MTGPELVSMAYKRPPITEAVIGINFSTPISKKDLGATDKKLSAHYPQHQGVSNYSLAVALPSQTTANVGREDGHRRSTADMTQLVVLWPSSFIVSQLAPYQGWEHFFERFARDWSALKRVTGFREISRVGVRYINRIDIPAKEPIVEHEKFLNIYPKIPDSLQPTSSYALQATVELKEIDCLLRLNSAPVPSPLLQYASFLIDQDISRQANAPQNDNEIYELLQKIHVVKNAVFEACITAKAREFFQ
ncbi:MAG: TIGR04255 family protein [Acidithiobacillus sp.]